MFLYKCNESFGLFFAFVFRLGRFLSPTLIAQVWTSLESVWTCPPRLAFVVNTTHTHKQTSKQSPYLRTRTSISIIIYPHPPYRIHTGLAPSNHALPPCLLLPLPSPPSPAPPPPPCLLPPPLLHHGLLETSHRRAQHALVVVARPRRQQQQQHQQDNDDDGSSRGEVNDSPVLRLLGAHPLG